MNLSNSPDTNAAIVQNRADESSVLAREAGVPFQPSFNSAAGIDPIVEWLSLMEVVQMLCPVWPVRDKPMQGSHWRL